MLYINNLNYFFYIHMNKHLRDIFQKYFKVKLIVLILFSTLLYFYIGDIFILTSVNGEIVKEGQKIDFLIYENPIHKVKIEYPSKWTITDNSNKEELLIKISLSEGEQYPRLFIETKTLNTNFSIIQQYVKEEIQRLQKTLLDFQLHELSNVSVTNENAEQAVYSFKIQHIRFKKLETWLMKENILYSINYISRESEFSDYLPIIKEMINSFIIN